MSDNHPTGDAYSAQTFYDDVALLLEQTLAEQPARQDLRLKLLEVYAAAGRRDAFAAHARAYKANLDEGLPGDWFKVRELGDSLLLPGHDSDPKADRESAPRSKRFGETDADTPLGRTLSGLGTDYERCRGETGFLDRFDEQRIRLTGRPLPPLYEAIRLSAENGGARLFLARNAANDLIDQKLANALLQGLLAVQTRRRELVAATRSGVHGVAVASVAAFLGLACRLHIRDGDGQTSQARLEQAEQLGAVIISHRAGIHGRQTGTRAAAAAALNELRELATADWLKDPDQRLLVNGLAAGPAPFPSMLRDAHAGPGRALRRELIRQTRHLPDAVAAPLDHGLDAFNLFVPFLGYQATTLIGAEQPAATTKSPEPDHPPDRRRVHYSTDQVAAAERILHAPGHANTQREHAWLRATGRVDYQMVAEEDVDRAAEALARLEGFVVSRRSARALATGLTAARDNPRDRAVAVLIENGLRTDGSRD
ncbi:pyridoxal-phosphate dependent enzyme [Spectribacter hydrogenooxidans]|uniref:tryptophan synthase n=1 Tax=Spectribacter hydrogenoxidans TaxID=3075608 RepID=A0ABU3BYH5_9GAMM|nr:pyridoxal-phosphate dependent enzyme [Salinisphaera sp. W335]MDT0634338.1 pyridoxal-phosphate dependent enzyme [Salinisphaera sp. W335]